MNNKQLTYLNGMKDGLPICAAYLAVSITFGFSAVQSEMPAWLATLLSATALTSTGQFAGINMILLGSSFIEIIVASLMINLRYFLMSLSLSQQIDQSTGTLKRIAMGFVVTDEIFAVASSKKSDLNFKYFMGLGFTPWAGWTLGTAIGALANSILPQRLELAMGIALYCMFIAIIIPPAKTEKKLFICIGISILLSCIIYFFIPQITFWFRVIIVAVIASSIMAFFFPIKTEEEIKKEEIKHDI